MTVIRNTQEAIALYCCFMATAAFVGFGTTHAFAQADMIGIYFDQVAVSNQFDTTETPQVVPAWVCITNLSAPSGLSAVACSGFSSTTFLCGQSTIGPQLGLCGLDWNFAAVPPLPNAPVLVVVECLINVPSPSWRVDLFIRPSNWLAPGQLIPSAYYYDNIGYPGAVFPLHPVSGSFDVPVAVINEGAVADSQLPWGAVKLLFR